MVKTPKGHTQLITPHSSLFLLFSQEGIFRIFLSYIRNGYQYRTNVRTRNYTNRTGGIYLRWWSYARIFHQSLMAADCTCSITATYACLHWPPTDDTNLYIGSSRLYIHKPYTATQVLTFKPLNLYNYQLYWFLSWQRDHIQTSQVVWSRGDQSGYFFILGIHLEGTRLVGRFQVL